MSQLPSAVLFDMDGTLIDSEGLWLEAEHAVMTQLGGTWSDADQAYCLGGPLERVADYMLERSGSGVASADVGTMLLDEMEQRFRASPLTWQPGARELLAECLERSVPTALVSASWNRLTTAVGVKIETDFGRSVFDVTVAGDDVDNSKPHPDPYLKAAAALGQEPAHCLAFEDSPTGVRSALAAGCIVIAIPHIADLDEPTALVIDTLAGRDLHDLWRSARR